MSGFYVERRWERNLGWRILLDRYRIAGDVWEFWGSWGSWMTQAFFSRGIWGSEPFRYDYGGWNIPQSLEWFLGLETEFEKLCSRLPGQRLSSGASERGTCRCLVRARDPLSAALCESRPGSRPEATQRASRLGILTSAGGDGTQHVGIT